MIDGQERITLEGGEKLSPCAAVEVQDWYARRWLMLHTPIPRRTFPETSPCDRYPTWDRRKCVRDAQAPPVERHPWLKPWQTNLTPAEAELRRHERPPARRQAMTAATRE